MVSAEVLAAAWLHDLGYAPSVARTGFHPLDGARFLQEHGISPGIVALVAQHTGAKFEAEERGFADDLDALPAPNNDDLDALTLLDLVVGPSGELTTPERARTEELRALKWQHVHLDDIPSASPPVPAYVEVWRSVRSGGDTKTRKSRRTLALPARAVEALRRQRIEQAELRL